MLPNKIANIILEFILKILMEDFQARLQYNGSPIKIAKTSILSLLSGKNTASVLVLAACVWVVTISVPVQLLKIEDIRYSSAIKDFTTDSLSSFVNLLEKSGMMRNTR